MVPTPRDEQHRQALVRHQPWVPVGEGSVACSRDHEPRGGSLDETARRLTHEEYDVAQQLASEGHEVRSLVERRRGRRTADLLVCGTPVEVKSWLSQQERGGVAPSTESVVNKLRQAEGQAVSVVLNGRGTGLTAASARAGMALYTGLRPRAQLGAVRVLGDGFDLAWDRQPSIRRDRRVEPARAAGPEQGVTC
jgi:hypothetical protein